MNHEFRCPVCHHSDVVDLPRGVASREVPCSYCGTALTLELRDDAELALEVRVASSEPGGGEGAP